MRYEIATVTRRGRQRATNADASIVDEAAGLFAVADGMGDEPRSVEVAQRALGIVRAALLDPPLDWSSDEACARREARVRLRDAVLLTNRRLYEARRSYEDKIGTTFAGAVIVRGFICVAHVGDSRVLLLRRRERHLAQLTVDHTVLADATWRGMPPDLVEMLPNPHALRRVLGLRPEVKVEPFADTWEPGDVLVLCTDGLSDRIEAHVIERLLLAIEDLNVAAERLIQRVIEVGGGDDVTVVLVRRAS